MNRALGLTAGAIVIAAVAGGLWLAGSPLQVRAMREDSRKLDALRQVEQQLHCAIEGEVLPPDFGEAVLATYCGRINLVLDLVDPVTGNPMLIEPIGPTSYRICTEFNDLAALTLSADQRTGLDMAEGCLEADIRG